jgi:hypothetical protein
VSPDTDADRQVPEGLPFLSLLWKQEDGCELATDERLRNLGKKAPACLEEIGTVLSFLDRMASCWWACRKSDHLVEYLCGRVGSTGRAALRLVRLGFFDESLALSRGIGEIANLFALFQQNEHAFEEWKVASRGDRLRKFSPVQVRLRLEDLRTPVPISQERYTLLSERAAHVHPGMKPQAHNILGIPMAGATLQDEGVLVCLNELAVALALSTAFGALVLDLDEEIRTEVVKSARRLGEQIGGATITEIDDYHTRVLGDPTAREELEFVSETLRCLQDERRR